MADPSRHSDTGGIPRWVKVSGIIAVVVALLVVVMLLSGGGGHGPQRHGGAGGDSSPSTVIGSAAVGGRTPPAGVHTPLMPVQVTTPALEGAPHGTRDPGQ